LPGHYTAKAEPRLNPDQRLEQAESFFAGTGAKISHGGNRAFYAPGADQIQMPEFESFRDAPAYYGTLGHESCHWTKAPARLDRDFSREFRGRKKWGDEASAMEELVAELGAAFLCADLELTPQISDDHAPYIASWLKVLKEHKRAIFTAAAHAQRAADFLHGLQNSSDKAIAA